jgi:hypothetical protein
MKPENLASPKALHLFAGFFLPGSTAFQGRAG